MSRNARRMTLAAMIAVPLSLASHACSRRSPEGKRAPSDALESPSSARAEEAAIPCGDPAARPMQVVTSYLVASQRRDVDGMLACMKPRHHDNMVRRASFLLDTAVISFSLGAERIDGDEASVEAIVRRYDGRGGEETVTKPIRLRRHAGAWYFR